jgi:hypothetical protein
MPDRSTDRHPEWVFGPVSGPVCGGLAAAAVVIAHPQLGYPVLLPFALCLVGAGVAALVTLRRAGDGLHLVYRVGLWIGAGWWTWHTLDAGLSWAAGFWLAAGMIVAGGLGPLFRDSPVDDKQEPPPPVTTVKDERAVRLKEAVDAFMGLGLPGVDILKIDEWDGQTGYDANLEFPPETGYGAEELQAYVIKLARRLRLPPGCIPLADDSDLVQGRVTLRVPLVDDLSQTYDYPSDFSELSILEPLPVAHFGDRSRAYVELREATILIGGRKGGGKTNIMDVICADLARCRDALIWHVDLNGGGMSVSWLAPWLMGEAADPIIDWPAYDQNTAWAMSEVALAITKARKSQYGIRTVLANSRLLPITPDVPEIVIMIDEAAEVLGDTCPIPKMRDNFTEIVRIGRAVGINLVISTLRPIGDHVPVQVRKNCAIRIATRVEEDSELDYMFGYRRGLRSRHLRSNGEAFFYRGDEDGENSIRKVKSDHLLPLRIAAVCKATDQLRPKLDEGGRRAAQTAIPDYPQVYEDRWKLVEPFLNNMRAELGDQTAGMTPVESVAKLVADGVLPLPHDAPHDPGEPPSTTADAVSAYRQAVDRARRAARAEEIREKTSDPQQVEQAFAGITAGLQPAKPAAADGVALVVGIVTKAGEDGIMFGDIMQRVNEAGLNRSRQTVTDWLNEGEKQGLIRSAYRTGGKQGLWLPAERPE